MHLECIHSLISEKFFYELKLCQEFTTMETAETRSITATTFRWLWICHRIPPKFLAQQCQWRQLLPVLRFSHRPWQNQLHRQLVTAYQTKIIRNLFHKSKLYLLKLLSLPLSLIYNIILYILYYIISSWKVYSILFSKIFSLFICVCDGKVYTHAYNNCEDFYIYFIHKETFTSNIFLY